MNIYSAIKNFSVLLNEKIDQILPKTIDNNNPNELYNAMRYTVFAPAKHLRPFLVYASSQIYGIELERVLPICAALEFIHVYSLIHDDLPCMDNDDMRRNQPSCHKKFGEAIAMLTGNALQTLAFEVLSTVEEDSSVKCEIIKLLCQSAGGEGMIGGQALEICVRHTDLEYLKRVQLLKSSKLFSAACEIGAVLGKSPLEERSHLHEYGKNLGCAFQIKDDIKDKNQDKENIVSILGIEQAEKYMNSLLLKSEECIKVFSQRNSLLLSLVEFVKCC